MKKITIPVEVAQIALDAISTWQDDIDFGIEVVGADDDPSEAELKQSLSEAWFAIQEQLEASAHAARLDEIVGPDGGWRERDSYRGGPGAHTFQPRAEEG